MGTYWQWLPLDPGKPTFTFQATHLCSVFVNIISILLLWLKKTDVRNKEGSLETDLWKPFYSWARDFGIPLCSSAGRNSPTYSAGLDFTPALLQTAYGLALGKLLTSLPFTGKFSGQGFFSCMNCSMISKFSFNSHVYTTALLLAVWRSKGLLGVLSGPTWLFSHNLRARFHRGVTVKARAIGGSQEMFCEFLWAVCLLLSDPGALLSPLR